MNLTEITKKILEKIKGKQTPAPDPRIYLLKKMPKKSVCAEIGAWKGDFSQNILHFTDPKKLYLIDPYKYVSSYNNALYGGKAGSQEKMDEIYKSVIDRFSYQIECKKLEIIRSYSAEGLDSFENNSLDWIYIDGNHTYEFVKNDLNGSWKKVRIGGYITGDDYGLAGWWDNGVKKAVDEFMITKKNSISNVELIDTQFIFKKIKD